MIKAQRPETVGFMLSAAVPMETVGHVLKAMYDAGCPPNSIDIKAIGKANGHGHGSELPSRHEGGALPAQKRAYKKHGTSRTAKAREVILAYVRAYAPVKRQELLAHLSAQFPGMVHQTVDTLVLDFTKTGQLVRAGTGVIAIGPAMPQAPDGPAAPLPEERLVERQGAEEGMPPPLAGRLLQVYQHFEAEPLRTWSKAEAAKALKLGPGTVKGCVDILAKRGLLKKAAYGKYTLTPR